MRLIEKIEIYEDIIDFRLDEKKYDDVWKFVNLRFGGVINFAGKKLKYILIYQGRLI